jgi:N-acetyl-gamma-glutamyl-phosphate reductase
MNKTEIAIFGASGYSGEELLRRLVEHPRVQISYLTSRQHAGKPVAEIFNWVDERTQLGQLKFSEPDVSLLAETGVPFAFLALPHGAAAEYVGQLLEQGIKTLDLSADFRLKESSVYADFYGQKHPAPDLLAKSVYGLPEVYRDEIRKSDLIACPGCYPTSILLPLLPLVRQGLVRPETAVVCSLSGVSGAGRKAELALLFVECNESVRAYGLPRHRHLSEIEQELSLAAGRSVQIQFAPHLVPINRGILTTIHVEPVGKVNEEELGGSFHAAYGKEPFIRLLGTSKFPDVKNVAYTNRIEIGWRVDPRTGKVILLSAEDNLVKGAAGQAVQCLNIMQGWDEDLGLS